MTQLLRLLVMAIAVALMGSFDLPSAEAAPTSITCKRKKKKRKKRKKKRRARKRSKKKRKKRRAVARRGKKATYKSVVKWWNQGLSDKQIIARVRKASYSPSKKDLKRMRRKGVGRGLVKKLSKLDLNEGTAVAAAPDRPKRIILENLESPDDIDFDSVPPPEGVPRWVKKEEEKRKKLNRSLRPSAPFEGKKKRAGNDNASTGRRRVVVSSK